MSEVLCGGLKTSESEFQNGLTAACGPNALAAALRWSVQSASAPTTYATFQKMRGLSLGGANGLSDLNELEQTARNFYGTNSGFTVVAPNSGEGVLAFMRRMAGVAAVVWETNYGQALRDYLTGYGEDATNLQRHILCSWGTNSGGTSARTTKILPSGFWMSDGDNDSQNLQNGVRYHWPINQRLVYYPDTVVSAAQPIGAFAVLPRVRVSAEGFMGIPTGWRDDGTTLTAPNGIGVVKGFRDWVLSHAWDANNTPLAVERAITSGSIEPGNASIGPGSRQDFRLGSLGWTTKTGVYVIAVGQDLVALAQQNAALLAQVATANSQIGSLQQQLAQQTTQQTIAQSAIAELKKALATTA
jgi:hypothetical protein